MLYFIDIFSTFAITDYNHSFKKDTSTRNQEAVPILHTSDDIFHSFVAGKMAPFYERYFPGMVMYASRLLGHELDWMADDCVQDAVLDSFQKRHSFDTAEQWRAHILACIRNKAVSALRKLSAMRNYTESKNEDDHEADATLALIEHETLDTLYAAIKKLPPDYRQLLKLSFEDGLKNAEIAAVLGVAEITVKKRKVKLLEMLRRNMPDDIDLPTIALLLTTMLKTV